MSLHYIIHHAFYKCTFIQLHLNDEIFVGSAPDTLFFGERNLGSKENGYSYPVKEEKSCF